MRVQAPPTAIPKAPSIAAPAVTKESESGSESEYAFRPIAPGSFESAGLDPGIVEALILKYLLGVGSAPGGSIARALCLPAAALTELLSELKRQQIVVYVGTATMGDFTYTLTDAGRDRAARFMVESMYVGAAPVTVDDYIVSVNAQTITVKNPRESELREAFKDLLISPQMFATLGPAINSGRGMFLYGYPGNGKTSIAERITACFGDEIWIPRCVICDGLIIRLFDPVNHMEVPEESSSIVKSGRSDPRWVKIRRPTLVAGGELTMSALEVQYNPTSKTCEAPIQMKSNCGTLVIDDSADSACGRSSCSTAGSFRSKNESTSFRCRTERCFRSRSTS